MRLSSATFLFATCAALALTGCADDAPIVTPDAGTSTDAGSDAGTSTDAGTSVSSATVTTSRPSEGEADVYPLEMYLDASGQTPVIAFRKVLTLTFSEPMDPSAARVTLHDRTDTTAPARVLTGTWSEDARTLTVTVPRTEESTRPLEVSTHHALSLDALKDAAGRALSADTVGLGGDTALDFTTGERDPELEHACTHTLANPPEAVTAGRTPFDFPPDTHTGHARYDVTLRPVEAGFGGYTGFISDPENAEHVTLYLNQEVPTKVTNDTAGTDVASVLAPARFICAGITHTLTFTSEPGDQIHLLQFGPVASEHIQFVLERE
ncbi:Ig-like domain-containing protein [Corallococcus sp. AS-1-12]|uniref:Ig-like domain-containing protein n=1 Tax=Corallococcus sp. AS-1-12 TaxID=2874598 RepID=UPI001CBB3F08|nr:Ig-like domain-containing protein [Corallococcus sp. AS-1-12]MBZ4332283.1 Ig-like domain-containing protein [Corallococcus sp. AS-1-12]